MIGGLTGHASGKGIQPDLPFGPGAPEFAIGHYGRVEAGEQVEREIRQLRLMLERLDRFRRGDLPIGPVINDLKALLYELELVDEAWRNDFVEAWSELEIPYAVALNRLDPIPTIRDENVAEGVKALHQLVRARLTALVA